MKMLVVTRSILYLIRLLPLARIFGVIAIAAKEFVQMEMNINLKKDDLNITVTLFFKSEDAFSHSLTILPITIKIKECETNTNS